MPKATLEFDLPEEAAEHRAALDGQKWKAVVEDMSLYLRDQAKFCSGILRADDLTQKLAAMIQDNGLRLD